MNSLVQVGNEHINHQENQRQKDSQKHLPIELKVAEQEHKQGDDTDEHGFDLQQDELLLRKFPLEF